MRRHYIKFAATAILAVTWAALAAGCITVGYDFLRQQATLTYTKPAETGLKK
jgi:hypothetical protein